MDVIDLLEHQHEELEELFDEALDPEGDPARAVLELARGLALHARAEERGFYRALALGEDLAPRIAEATAEHYGLDALAAALVASPADARVRLEELRRLFREHVARERAELFAKARERFAAEALAAMADALLEAMVDLRRAIGESADALAPSARA